MEIYLFHSLTFKVNFFFAQFPFIICFYFIPLEMLINLLVTAMFQHIFFLPKITNAIQVIEHFLFFYFAKCSKNNEPVEFHTEII